MITYDDLPEEIKATYTKEQCGQLITAVERLNIFCENFLEALRKMLQILRPQIEDFIKKWNEISKTFNHEQSYDHNKNETFNHKQSYGHNKKRYYKEYIPRFKQIKLCKKAIYHHIRNNC